MAVFIIPLEGCAQEERRGICAILGAQKNICIEAEVFLRNFGQSRRECARFGVSRPGFSELEILGIRSIREQKPPVGVRGLTHLRIEMWASQPNFNGQMWATHLPDLRWSRLQYIISREDCAQ
jgi:hypothetical protein